MRAAHSGPPAIRQAAHNRLYLEQLALVDNPRLSRQQARCSTTCCSSRRNRRHERRLEEAGPHVAVPGGAATHERRAVLLAAPAAASPRQPKPGEEVWRLRKAAHVQSCELRNDSNLGAG